MSRILLIEDDLIISKGLRLALEAEGYEVVLAYDGAEGLFKANTEAPDLIVLDIMMPQMNGFEVAMELRRSGDRVPIIVLSARTESADKVRGLDLGADDYVEKPFDLDELLARVRRQLGRRSQVSAEFGDYRYDWQLKQLQAKASGEAIALTAKERRLLEFLLKRAGQIVTREQVLDAVWGADYDGTDRTVDNLVVSLRKKVGAACLVTERGSGYRFVTKP
jgi:DNA-binding response OmpR family regulator